MIKGMVFYDSGIKLENVSSKNAKLKARSQLKVKHKNFDSLYKNFEFIDIATTNMWNLLLSSPVQQQSVNGDALNLVLVGQWKQPVLLFGPIFPSTSY